MVVVDEDQWNAQDVNGVDRLVGKKVVDNRVAIEKGLPIKDDHVICMRVVYGIELFQKVRSQEFSRNITSHYYIHYCTFGSILIQPADRLFLRCSPVVKIKLSIGSFDTTHEFIEIGDLKRVIEDVLKK